jgi:diketogulonate reductase-like aldo/keto reductase
MSEEYIQITALLTQDQIAFLDEVARQKGVRGRQAPLRWAIEHYRIFLSASSTYRSDRIVEQTADQPTEPINA